MSYQKFSPELKELVRHMIVVHMQQNDALISASDVSNIVSAVSVLHNVPGAESVGKAAEAKPELNLPDDMPQELKDLITGLVGDSNVEVHMTSIDMSNATEEDKSSIFQKLKAMHERGATMEEGKAFLKSQNANPGELLAELLGELKNDLLRGLTERSKEHAPHFQYNRECDGIFGKVSVYKDLNAENEWRIILGDLCVDIEMKPGHDFDVPYQHCIEMIKARGRQYNPDCLMPKQTH